MDSNHRPAIEVEFDYFLAIYKLNSKRSCLRILSMHRSQHEIMTIHVFSNKKIWEKNNFGKKEIEKLAKKKNCSHVVLNLRPAIEFEYFYTYWTANAIVFVVCE